MLRRLLIIGGRFSQGYDAGSRFADFRTLREARPEFAPPPPDPLLLRLCDTFERTLDCEDKGVALPESPASSTRRCAVSWS